MAFARWWFFTPRALVAFSHRFFWYPAARAGQRGGEKSGSGNAAVGKGK